MSYVMSTSGKIEKGQHVSEWVLLDGGSSYYWVHKFNIIGTAIVDYEVFEKCGNRFEDGVYIQTHSTFTYKDEDKLGDVTTRALPASVDALPYGSARIQAVGAWYDASKALAKAVAVAAFPEDFSDF